MKRAIIFLIFILTISVVFGAKNNRTSQIQEVSNEQNVEEFSSSIMPFAPLLEIAQGDKWWAFWITFVIAAIGVYSIYGFSAGIIAVAITYFATNGNKKVFRKAIWGCVAGCVVGALILLLKLSLMA